MTIITKPGVIIKIQLLQGSQAKIILKVRKTFSRNNSYKITKRHI